MQQKQKKSVESNNPLITTWELKHLVKTKGAKQTIKVIVIKEGAGKVKFLSAMSRKHNNTKKPRKKP